MPFLIGGKEKGRHEFRQNGEGLRKKGPDQTKAGVGGFKGKKVEGDLWA